MEGWIKLYRQLITNGWLRNHNVCIFWIYCLLKAVHEPTKAIVGFQEVNLEPGQFIFGRRKAAKETGLSERETRTCLAFLSKAQNVAIKTTHQFSIISIVNWDTYQNSKSENDPANDPRATHGRPHTRMKRIKEILSPAFEVFYSAYPKHKARRDAVKAWEKLNPDGQLQKVIITALEKQKQSEDWKKEDGRYIPLPASWLNGRRWEDEVQEVKPKW